MSMPVTLRCLIVDDDSMACKSLERLCRRHDHLDVAAVCSSATDAVAFLEKQSVDIVFLDIEMPEHSGIDFLNMASYIPMVVFTTGKKDYAFEAFEYAAIDYLIKPVTWPRFRQAVERVFEAHERARKYKASANELYIREERRYIRLDCNDILYFENVGDYIRIKTVRGTHVIHGTLKQIDEKLQDDRFLRVHRSYIVNLGRIKDIEEGSLIVDGNMIPVSRTHKPVLMGRLKVL